MKLVTAILPTRGRREWAQRAMRCFEDQTYPNRELVILDDSDDPSFPNPLPGARLVDGGWIRMQHPKIRYKRLTDRQNIPAKRNIAASMAAGEIIWTLDSDDYSAPERMAAQVELLESSGKAMCGFHSMLFFDESTRRAWRYQHRMKTYAIGTSQTYLKSWWAEHPFIEIETMAEDAAMGDAARREDQIVCVDAGNLMVARIHKDNTTIKDVGGVGIEFRPIPLESIPAAFFQ